MNEEWKNILGYENFYQVSNLGNVRSIERTFVNSRGEKRTLVAGPIKAIATGLNLPPQAWIKINGES